MPTAGGRWRSQSRFAIATTYGSPIAVAVLILSLAFASVTRAQMASDHPLDSVDTVSAMLEAHPFDDLHLILIHGMRTADRTTWNQFRGKICAHLPTQCAPGSSFEGPLTQHLELQSSTPWADYFGGQVWSDRTDQTGPGSTAADKWVASRPFVDHYRLPLRGGRSLFVDEINYWPLLFAFKCQFVVAPEAQLAGPDSDDIKNCALKDETHYAWFSTVYASQLLATTPAGGSAPLLNAYVKDSILDWGISDAVLSLGTLDRYLRETVRCSFYEIATETPQSFSRGLGPPVFDCGLAQGAPPDVSGVHFAIISHSLGAFILMDAFAAAAGDANHYDQGNADECRTGVQPLRTGNARLALEVTAPLASPDIRAEIQSSQALCWILRKSANLYFLANQFPLIEMARTQMPETLSGAAPPESALVLWGETKDSLDEEKQIVAFSDPGDILTFYVPSIPGVDVINAYPQNATRWFGLLEMPGAAHLNYLVNDKVLQVIFGE